MQLKVYTDYSLRVLIYLALRRGRLVNIAEIAQAYGISRNHLVKVVHNLARGGFVRSHRGKGGGIELAREPGAINVGSVVRWAEGPLRPAECFDAERNRCVIAGACGLTAVLREAADNFLATLDHYTLADLVGKRARLSRSLGIDGGERRWAN
jgi:Rrf2 family nitric oxide-sensitive transcriptional repressor